MDPATITAWKEAILGIKEVLSLVALIWLLVYTYARVIPNHLANISTPIVAAVTTLSLEMKELRGTLIDALRRGSHG